MSTTTEPKPATTAEPGLPRRRWTEADLAGMAEAGLLREGDGTILVGGDLLDPGAGMTRRRWTEEEYGLLMHAGILREGGPEFLWDGEVIGPMPENPPHIHASENLQELLRARFSSPAWVHHFNHPIQLREGFRPQPDMAVLSGLRTKYRGRLPGPPDIAIVCEVSSTSYLDDGRAYLREYARAGIAQYWIVNIRDRRVEVYTGTISEPLGYGLRRDFGLDDVVPVAVEVAGPPAEFAGITVREILQDSLGGG